MMLADERKFYLKVDEVIHNSTVAMHVHGDFFGSYGYEIVYVNDGECTHLIGSRRERIKKGDFFFLDTGVRHGYEVEESKSISITNLTFDFRMIDVSLKDGNTLADLAYRLGINESMDNLKVRDDYSFTDSEDGYALSIISKIQREIKEHSAGYRQVVKGALLELLIYGFRQYFVKSETQYSRETQYLIDRINENYMLSPTLTKLAEQMNASVAYLSVKFRREVGRSFLEYLHAKRISEGARLIAMTDESIEMIAERVGYSDAKKFRERFKNVMGISPREYRKGFYIGK